MSLTEECMGSEGEVEPWDDKARDISLDGLMQMSQSLKTNIESNFNKFKHERIPIVNEISKLCGVQVSLEQSDVTVSEPVKRLTLDSENNDNFGSFTIDNNNVAVRWKKSYETLNGLEDDLKTFRNLLNAQGGDFNQSIQSKAKEDEHPLVEESPKRKVDEVNGLLNSETFRSDEMEKYRDNMKKLLEAENKCQRWADKYDELHAKYLKLESKCVAIEKVNCSYQIELARIKSVEDENRRLSESVDKLVRARNELEAALESCHETMYKYKSNEETARNKVREAVEIVEKTCLEKQQAVDSLDTANAEIERLQSELKTLVQEAGVKVHTEVEKIKDMFRDKLKNINAANDLLKTEKQTADRRIERMSKEYADLREDFQLLSQKCAEEPIVHSKKLASLVQQIGDYEIWSEQLTADVEILKEANRKIQESYARKRTKYTMEIAFLRDTVESLEGHLSRAMRQIADDNEKMVDATDRLKTLEMEMSKSSRKKTEEDLEQKDKQIINELTKHVEAYKRMMDIWEDEIYEITNGFKNRIIQLKSRCRQLYQKNSKLKRMINVYKENKRLKTKKTFIKYHDKTSNSTST
ncbi:kinesin-like protein KIF15 [Adelges cooleyi]|uniref:kinesin-like protein KIF15 n=1 Tax=Adelges cooleyi TaxID=133065 RepID=UPI0021801940|nr:kinesin-like protein KIF15 [Adelges cooleyi]